MNFDYEFLKSKGYIVKVFEEFWDEKLKIMLNLLMKNDKLIFITHNKKFIFDYLLQIDIIPGENVDYILFHLDDFQFGNAKLMLNDKFFEKLRAEKDCIICYTNIDESNNTLLCCPECLNTICSECKRKVNKCPLCRADIS